MSKRAQKAALEVYPVDIHRLVYQDLIELFGGKAETDTNTYPRRLFQEGYEHAEKDLGWHSVKESLPPIDEEVIALTDVTNGQCIKGSHRICFGHIVNPKYCDALECDGWNIPGITHWMYLPKIIEENNE